MYSSPGAAIGFFLLAVYAFQSQCTLQATHGLVPDYVVQVVRKLSLGISFLTDFFQILNP